MNKLFLFLSDDCPYSLAQEESMQKSEVYTGDITTIKCDTEPVHELCTLLNPKMTSYPAWFEGKASKVTEKPWDANDFTPITVPINIGEITNVDLFFHNRNIEICAEYGTTEEKYYFDPMSKTCVQYTICDEGVAQVVKATPTSDRQCET